MLIELLSEVQESHSHFITELDTITDKQLIRQRIQGYRTYLEQFMALKEEYGSETRLPEKSFYDREVQVNDSLVSEAGEINIDFDKFLQERMAEGEKAVEVADFEELKDSTRKSMEFLIQKAGADERANISSISKVNDESLYSNAEFSINEAQKVISVDTETSFNNYEMTDLSMLDSSFNVTHDYCYKDARGNIVSSGNKEPNSFDKFIKCEKIAKENNATNDHMQSMYTKRYLYCNDKRIPDWATDLNIVSDIVTKQKAEGIHRKTFGVFKGVTNLDLEEVLGVRNESYKRRGDSVFGTTPESSDIEKRRMGNMLKLADIDFNMIK